jgi:DNA adenine methylase
MSPCRAVLSDVNKRLIETYAAVRASPEKVIEYLASWPNSKEVYYRLRGEILHDKYARAAQFIFLNKTCWNGLYRVNKRGIFNVPFASHDRQIYDESNLLLASELLQKAELSTCEFEVSLSRVSTGDFVYLDPPYTVLHSNNGFRRYNEQYFSWEDQVRLAKTATLLMKRGCYVAISNADHSEVVRLFQDFYYYSLDRHSTLASKSSARRRTREALFLSFNMSAEHNP